MMSEKTSSTVRTILLDGLWGNPARLGTMQRRLERFGLRHVETFKYQSSGFACLIGEGKRLAEKISDYDEPVNLMGYSMGGLVIRAALHDHTDLPVRKAAFVNTPHRGSLLARYLPGVGIAQMRPGCDFLTRMEGEESRCESMAVWTPGDLMVLPSTSARWGGATKTCVCHVPAHVWPLFSPRVHRELAAFFLS